MAEEVEVPNPGTELDDQVVVHVAFVDELGWLASHEGSRIRTYSMTTLGKWARTHNVKLEFNGAALASDAEPL